MVRLSATQIAALGVGVGALALLAVWFAFGGSGQRQLEAQQGQGGGAPAQNTAARTGKKTKSKKKQQQKQQQGQAQDAAGSGSSGSGSGGGGRAPANNNDIVIESDDDEDDDEQASGSQGRGFGEQKGSASESSEPMPPAPTTADKEEAVAFDPPPEGAPLDRQDTYDQRALEEMDQQEEAVEKFHALVKQGTKLFKGGKYQKAADKYTEALEVGADVPKLQQQFIVVYNNRGAMYQKLGEHEKSLADVAVVLAMDGRHLKARLRKARLLQEMDHLEDALTEACTHTMLVTSQIRRAVPQSAIMGGALSEAQQNALMSYEKQTQESIMLMQSIAHDLSVQKAKEYTWDEKPLSLPTTHNMHEYLRCFAAGRNLYAEFMDVQEQDVEEAVSEAAENSAEQVEALLQRGKFRCLQDEYEAANEDFMRLMEIFDDVGEVTTDPDTLYGVYLWCGTFYHTMRQWSLATECFEKAVQQRPFDVDARTRIAGVQADKGQYETALETLQLAEDKAVEAGDDESMWMVHFYRYMIYSTQSEAAKAKEAISELVRRKPEDPFFRAIYVRALADEEDPTIALQALRDAKEQCAETAELLLSEAMLRGADPEVNDLYDRAAEIAPENPAHYIARAQSCPDPAQAREYLDKALEVDPSSIDGQLLVLLSEMRNNLTRSGFAGLAEQFGKVAPQCRTLQELQTVYLHWTQVAAFQSAMTQLGVESQDEL